MASVFNIPVQAQLLNWDTDTTPLADFELSLREYIARFR